MAGDKEAIDKSRGYVKTYRQRCGEDGERMTSTLKLLIERKQKKDKRLQSLAICTTDVDLGGCDGEDITEDVLKLMVADRKVLKSLKKSGFTTP